MDVPRKKLAVWCDYCSAWDYEFCIFTTSVGDSEFVFESFRQHCSRCLHIACRAGHEPLHVTDTTYGSKHCQAVFDHLSLFISWGLLLGGSKGVKMDAVDRDYLPWLSMRQCAISIHEIDSNSNLVPPTAHQLACRLFLTI